MELLEEYAKEYGERGGDMEKGRMADAAAAELAMLYMSRNGMAGAYQPFMKEPKGEEDMERGKADRGLEEARESARMHRKIGDVIMNLHSRLSDVELVCGDFMDDAYIGNWEDEGTFNYLDVPYPYRKRGVKGKRKGTGYQMDWADSEHGRFLDRVERMYREGRLRGKLMICSNFEVDGDGGLKGLRDDMYNQRLMELGFRLVVTELIYSCEAHLEGDGSRRKTRKAEVVWINYKDIIGSWGELEHYDIQDVY